MFGGVSTTAAQDNGLYAGGDCPPKMKCVKTVKPEVCISSKTYKKIPAIVKRNTVLIKQLGVVTAQNSVCEGQKRELKEQGHVNKLNAEQKEADFDKELKEKDEAFKAMQARFVSYKRTQKNKWGFAKIASLGCLLASVVVGSINLGFASHSAVNYFTLATISTGCSVGLIVFD